MPSPRFHNLKPVKKRTFLKMAYREFALHSYEGASITRLVSDLKMAKGSIYQYFEDKDDMYHYLVNHAFDQLHTVLNKACPLPNSSTSFDSWYHNYLMVYIKFLCTIPTYAFLFVRHRTDFSDKKVVSDIQIDELIIKASNGSLKDEKEYFLGSLPILIFKYILNTERVDPKEIIESGDKLDISSNKLLYLCEAFLNND